MSVLQGNTVKTFVFDTLQHDVRHNFKNSIGKLLQSTSVVKILHGCSQSDVIWLQRDFGIQLNNVFDTAEFYREFLSKNKSYVSLSHLWEEYCKGLFSFDQSQKTKFQRLDWSLRPLQNTSLDYAAHDTYFLHYISNAMVAQALQTHTVEQMQKWNTSFNEDKIFNAVYKLGSESFKFDTYRKTFKKLMDYFDPHSDKFLLTESIYRDLYNMRE